MPTRRRRRTPRPREASVSLELPSEVYGEHVLLEVLGAIEIVLANAVRGLEHRRVADVPAQADAVRQRRDRALVRVVERRAYVAPPWIPPAARFGRTVLDVGIDDCPAVSDLGVRREGPIEQVEDRFE